MFRRYFVIASSDGVGPRKYCKLFSIFMRVSGSHFSPLKKRWWKPITRKTLISQQKYKSIKLYPVQLARNYNELLSGFLVCTANTYQHMFYILIPVTYCRVVLYPPRTESCFAVTYSVEVIDACSTYFTFLGIFRQISGIPCVPGRERVKRAQNISARYYVMFWSLFSLSSV